MTPDRRFASQFDARAPATSATAHAGVCLQERTQEQGIVGQYPNKLTPGFCMFHQTGHYLPLPLPCLAAAQPRPSVRGGRLLWAPWRKKAA